MVSPGETLLVQASSMRPSIARRLGNGRPVASNAPRSRRWRSDQIHVSAGGASMTRTGPPCTSRASSYSALVTPATRGGSGDRCRRSSHSTAMPSASTRVMVVS